MSAIDDASIRDGLVTVFLFGAKWCRACKAQIPQLCRMAADFPEATFLLVQQSDATQAAFSELDITSLPTLLFTTGAHIHTTPANRDSFSWLKEQIRSSDAADEVEFTA